MREESGFTCVYDLVDGYHQVDHLKIIFEAVPYKNAARIHKIT